MGQNIRYLFTLFFIIGFQPHCPVTMLPASRDSDILPQIIETGSLVLEKGNAYMVGSDGATGKLTDNFASGNTHKEDNSGDQSPVNLQFVKHGDTSAVLDTPPLQTLSVHENINETRRGVPRDINSSLKLLNGLESRLNKDQIDSSKSVFNRIKEVLPHGKLEQGRGRVANLSGNLKTRENIFTTNNGDPAVNAQKSYQDGNGYSNNNTTIKSGQSVDKQIVTDSGGLLGDNRNDQMKSRYVEGVFWSPEVEANCPNGFRDVGQQARWRNTVKNFKVVKIEVGCGSMQNRLITFNDSTQACVRYRLNSDQMQGEIYSYYLGKMLNINYTPNTVMHLVGDSEQWRPVKGAIAEAKWTHDKPIIVTKWIESMEPVYIPNELKDIKRKLHQENYHLGTMSPGQICDLVQWSDLIVFDYISANLDRVVNNLFNLKWNSRMFEKPIHNLEKVGSTGQYVFIDNESGLFHSYRLLTSYRQYHDQLLEPICVFRKSTVDALERLFATGDAGDRLQHLYETNEQYHGFLPRMGPNNKQILQSRIQEVVKHIHRCKHQSLKS